ISHIDVARFLYRGRGYFRIELAVVKLHLNIVLPISRLTILKSCQKQQTATLFPYKNPQRT
ncbi:MAG: hypothetical protein VX761_08805, partial [Planctomycetota bacterium]|nr:hypothetical protein [Planctomycetota bacterium]